LGFSLRIRVLPELGKEIVEQIEEAWRLPQPDWARKRLLVVRLIAQHEHIVAAIMKIAGVCRQTVFTYRDKVMAEGVEGLLKRDWAGARVPTVRGALADEFLKQLEQGKFRQAGDAQAWIKKRTRKTLTESGVRQIIHRLGGKLKVPRKKPCEKGQQCRRGIPRRFEQLPG
jgi:transposase